MNLLLDTHILLWWLSSPSKLSKQAFELIENPENNVYVSSASIWEITIKRKLGKLEIPDGIKEAVDSEGFIFLPITEVHALALEKLPDIHHDPFDRVLITQAISDNMILITRDAKVMVYDLPLVKG